MKVRKSVYELDDDTLYWYSKAVEHLKARDINDPTSWWYLAAVHGYYNLPPSVTYWQEATGYPPSQSTISSGYWMRCQHGTWYFLPWHRMYLYYFERIVADAVLQEGGPADWALPYWNYCDAVNPDIDTQAQSKALTMPSGFGDANGPNSSSPGLWIRGRRNYVLNKLNVNPWPAMNELLFTNDSSGTNFGGGVTGFSHFGNETGQVESLPHNVIHNNIGGAMADPNTAALDPIFWLHHANIDRLWQIWQLQTGRANPMASQWRDFTFKFHDVGAVPVTMKVKEVETTQHLNYTYSQEYPAISATQPTSPPLSHFALDVVGASLQQSAGDKNSPSFNLDMVPKSERNASLAKKSAPSEARKKTLIKVSNVTGKGDVPPLNVYINSGNETPEGTRNFVSCIGLFGLADASYPTLDHDGSGLSFVIDATDVVETLRRRDNWDEENISIQLVPQESLPEGADYHVGRVSLHSEID